MYTKKTYGLFALVCLIFSTTFLAIRIGLLGGASPLLSSGLRFILAGTVLVLFLLFRRKLDFDFLRRRFPQLALLSLFQSVLTFGAMYIAETWIDSGYMARLDSLGPVFTAFFALLFLRKKLKFQHGLGLALGTLGTFLLAGELKEAHFGLGPLVIALVGVAAYALGMVVYNRYFDSKDDPFVINAFQMLLGGILLTVASPLFEVPSFPLNGSTLGSLVYLAFIGSIIAHSANFMVIRDAGAVFASAWLYVSPILASVLGFLVLGEALSLYSLFGTLLALLGVLVLNKAEKLQNPLAHSPKLPAAGSGQGK